MLSFLGSQQAKSSKLGCPLSALMVRHDLKQLVAHAVKYVREGRAPGSDLSAAAKAALNDFVASHQPVPSHGASSAGSITRVDGEETGAPSGSRTAAGPRAGRSDGSAVEAAAAARVHDLSGGVGDLSVLTTQRGIAAESPRSGDCDQAAALALFDLNFVLARLAIQPVHPPDMRLPSFLVAHEAKLRELEERLPTMPESEHVLVEAPLLRLLAILDGASSAAASRSGSQLTPSEGGDQGTPDSTV
jgi:hypothetical protein